MKEGQKSRSVIRMGLELVAGFLNRHLVLKALIKQQMDLIKSGLFDRFLYIRRYGPTHCHISTKRSQEKLNERAGKRFEVCREKYGDKRCFVIGNGPSLNKLDMTKLKSEVTIGSNGLFLNYDKMGFYPTFYTVVNYLIAEQMGPEICNIEESVRIFPSFLRGYFRNAKGEVIFLNAHHAHECSEDVTQWASWRSTVTFFNLQVAFSLGCPEVYLVGVDNTYVQPPDSQEGRIVVQKGQDVNHFAPHYFATGFRWQQADPDLMTEVYKLAKTVFVRNGRVIMNATHGGSLEVFPRVNYDDLFAPGNPVD